MDMIIFNDKVRQAREEDCKIICFICPDNYSKYHLYFVHDIVDPNISLSDYDYEEVKGVEHVLIELKEYKFKQTEVGIGSKSVSQIIRDSVMIDFGMDSKKIIERFMLYINYFIQFSDDPDLYVFLYLYAESMYNQRKVAKLLGISIQSLYDTISINDMRLLARRGYLLNCESLKYKYIGMVYVNVYTFDIYLQLHYCPNIDTLLVGITRPISGNLLVNVLSGDTSEQVISQCINLQSDFFKILKQSDQKVDSR